MGFNNRSVTDRGRVPELITGDRRPLVPSLDPTGGETATFGRSLHGIFKRIFKICGSAGRLTVLIDCVD
jgi:hypothetical protein